MAQLYRAVRPQAPVFDTTDGASSRANLVEVAPCLCQSRRARRAIDFSMGWACVSRASDVLGVCIMITSALLRTETERWRKEYAISRPARSYWWALGRLGVTVW